MKKWIGFTARTLVGAIFLVFGANGILQLFFGYALIEMQPPEEGSAVAQYFKVLAGTYLLKTVKIIEVLGALMLLSGVFLPLGAILLAPIVVNIFLFHLTMDPCGNGYGCFTSGGGGFDCLGLLGLFQIPFSYP